MHGAGPPTVGVSQSTRRRAYCGTGRPDPRQLPLTTDEFAALMAPLGPFASDRRLAVAVSGGADSMALAWLLARWGRPMALIVDHGLRPESAAEAVGAARSLRTFGVQSEIIPLEGLRPGAAAARHARYDALISRCGALGIIDLVVAHHAQDQAETVLMRAARGSGMQGLAGMARVTVRGGVRLLRPLLPIEPGRLRTTLVAAGVAWCEDPGNTNPATVRGALRHSFPHHPALVPRALSTQQDAAQQRAIAEKDVADELARHVTMAPDGLAHLTGEISAPALSALVWAVSGRAYPPAPAMVARALPVRSQTLHGVTVTLAGWRGGGWVFMREHSSTEMPQPTRPLASASLFGEVQTGGVEGAGTPHV